MKATNDQIDFRAAALTHIEKAAEGLDLHDPDDRALFRTRLDHSYEPVTVSGITAHAEALGLKASSGSRRDAGRSLADGWLRQRGYLDS